MWHVPSLSSLSPDVWVWVESHSQLPSEFWSLHKCGQEGKVSGGRRGGRAKETTHILRHTLAMHNWRLHCSQELLCGSQHVCSWFLVPVSPAPAATLSLYLQAAAAAEIGYNLTQKNDHFIWAIKSNTHVAGPQTQIESLGELRRRWECSLTHSATYFIPCLAGNALRTGKNEVHLLEKHVQPAYIWTPIKVLVLCISFKVL